jgi:hypothetical protein
MGSTVVCRIMFCTFLSVLSALAGIGLMSIFVQQGWMRPLCVQEVPVYLDSVRYQQEEMGLKSEDQRGKMGTSKANALSSPMRQ